MGFFSKDIRKMDDLFVHTLRDIYYAENQILKALPEMIEKSSDPQLKQGLRAHLNDYAFASFDLLLCIQKGGIALQRRENRLIQSEGRHSAARDCFAICSLAAGKNRLTKNRERCN